MTQHLGDKNKEIKVLKYQCVCLGKAGPSKEAVECDLKALKLTKELNDKVAEQIMYREHRNCL